MRDPIWMEHPGLGPDRKQQVPRSAFESAWKRAGWVETDPPEPPEPQEPTVADEEDQEEVSQILEDISYDDDEELTVEEEN